MTVNGSYRAGHHDRISVAFERLIDNGSPGRTCLQYLGGHVGKANVLADFAPSVPFRLREDDFTAIDGVGEFRIEGNRLNYFEHIDQRDISRGLLKQPSEDVENAFISGPPGDWNDDRALLNCH
jgi:hypothetical protein